MVRSKDLLGFMEAVATKMGAPFERLLDQLEPPAPSLIQWPFRSFTTLIVSLRMDTTRLTFKRVAMKE
ncbi:hypothetical protein OIU78_018743 [Salix suchowensis]|nr:hypothetical protein OIU78_018743 [Salix suchowensis]